MNEIQYIGEHLWPRNLGQALIILQFVAALFAAFTFYRSHKTEQIDATASRQWFNLGRVGFWLHSFSLYAVIGTVFYIMINKYYEYQYVQAHVSDDLPMQYIFSAFWEGQEGSFMLWMFWHVILGGLLLWKAGKWRATTLTVLMLIQVVIGSMLLGVYVPGLEDFKIGSSPMLLLRDVMNIPIFAQADYVTLLQGTGLNPLLQNYWMTIHPPTLFLGFASTSIPFCFAVGGLMRQEYKAWLRPALPWALFSGGILGLGILMGGAWAYEALSFGGYWAWDPVENMSLVPWITLIAGIHCHVVAKATGYSIRSTALFYMLTFWLILYSTFMTRSGVLGETSVHAFTEMGLENQLVGMVLFFILLGSFYLIKNWKKIPSPKLEESFSSREFWMFIGSLVLLFSALLITISTSLPVFNKIVKIFDPFYEGVVITDAIEHYNKYQLWIAVFIGILSGFSQYLRFKEKNGKKISTQFWKHTGIAAALSLVIAYFINRLLLTNAWQYQVLTWSAVFAIITNLDYIVRIARFNLKLASSAFSHLGFAIMIIGVLASGLNKEYLSSNPTAQRNLIDGFSEEDYGKNILLFKGMPMFMNGYEVTYERDTLSGVTRTFEVSYKKLNEKGEPIDSFRLFPNILYTKTFDKVVTANPSTKRELAADVFTHITSLPRAEQDPEYAQSIEDSLAYMVHQIAEGGSTETENLEIKVGQITRSPEHTEYHPVPGDLAIGLPMQLKSKKSETWYEAQPVLVLRKDFLLTFPVQINALNTKVKLPQSIFEEYFQLENSLEYQSFELKKGGQAQVGAYRFVLNAVDSKPEHPNYTAKEGDIAIAANLSIQGPGNIEDTVAPIFLIRENQTFSIKDFSAALGLHVRFEKVDPKSESLTLSLAQNHGGNSPTISVEVAEDSLRADYIVLQAIRFPGINLFWLGSLLMMFGLFFGMIRRYRQ